MYAGESGWVCFDCDAKIIGYTVLSPKPSKPDTVGAFEADDKETDVCEDCDGEGTVDCPACDGTGTDACCHCGADMDCEECDGEGVVPCVACRGELE